MTSRHRAADLEGATNVDPRYTNARPIPVPALTGKHRAKRVARIINSAPKQMTASAVFKPIEK